MAAAEGHVSHQDPACHQELSEDTNRGRDSPECWMEGSGSGSVRCLRLLSPKLPVSLFFSFVGLASQEVFENIK